MEKKAKRRPKTFTSSRSIYAPARPRTPLTSRYAENCARKRGALGSCVAYRKWRKVTVCVKKYTSCDACRVRAREGGSQAARDGERGRRRAACWEAHKAARADRAHPSSSGYARSLSIKGMPICLRDSCARVCRLRMDTRQTPVKTGSAC
jgi:hypothetical protein